MKEDNPWDKFWEFFQNGGWIFIAIGAVIIGHIMNKRVDPYYSKKVYKNKLADEYGVTVELLMKWADRYFPDDIKANYVGEKVQRVKEGYFYKYLGKPEEFPKNIADEIIFSKQGFADSFFMDMSTLRRKIQKIEAPEEVIGMSYEDYGKVKTFPPKYASKIYNYLEK